MPGPHKITIEANPDIAEQIIPTIEDLVKDMFEEDLKAGVVRITTE